MHYTTKDQIIIIQHTTLAQIFIVQHTIIVQILIIQHTTIHQIITITHTTLDPIPIHTDPEAGIGFSKCPKRSEGSAFHIGQILDKI